MGKAGRPGLCVEAAENAQTARTKTLIKNRPRTRRPSLAQVRKRFDMVLNGLQEHFQTLASEPVDVRRSASFKEYYQANCNTIEFLREASNGFTSAAQYQMLLDSLPSSFEDFQENLKTSPSSSVFDFASERSDAYVRVSEHQSTVSLTAEETASTAGYKGAEFRKINPYLRLNAQGYGIEHQDLDRSIECLDQALQKTIVNEDILVSRTVGLDEAEEFGFSEEEILAMYSEDEHVEHGYMSTQFGSRMAANRPYSSKIGLLIEVPAGSNAMVYGAFNGGWDSETELILPRGSRLQLLHRKKMADTGSVLMYARLIQD